MEQIKSEFEKQNFEKNELENLRQAFFELQKEAREKKEKNEPYNSDLDAMEPRNITEEDLIMYKKLLGGDLTLGEVKNYQNKILKEVEEKHKEEKNRELNDPKAAYMSYIVNEFAAAELKKKILKKKIAK